MSIHSHLEVSRCFDEASLSCMISVFCFIARVVMMSRNNDEFKEPATWGECEWGRANSFTEHIEVGVSHKEQIEEKV